MSAYNQNSTTYNVGMTHHDHFFMYLIAQPTNGKAIAIANLHWEVTGIATFKDNEPGQRTASFYTNPANWVFGPDPVPAVADAQVAGGSKEQPKWKGSSVTDVIGVPG